MLHALVSSDWHIGGMNNVLSTLSSSVAVFGSSVTHSAVVDMQLREIEKVYKYAAINGIEHIFVPGDLFDSPFVPYETMIKFVLLLLKYKDVVKTYYIAGNHDFSEKGKTSLDVLYLLSKNNLLPNLHVYLEPDMLVIDDVNVGFLPYPCLKSIWVAEHCGNRGFLNFCHVDYPGALNDNGREIVLKDDSKKYRHGKLDFTISGHVHKHQTLKQQRFMYAGSLYQKTFGENLPKGFLEIKVDYNEQGRVVVNTRRLKNTSYWTLENTYIETQAEFESFEQKIAATPRVLYKVKTGEEVSVPVDFLSKNPNVVRLLSVRDKTVKDYEDLLTAIDKEDSFDEFEIEEEIDDTQDVTLKPKARKIDIMYGLQSFLLSRGHTQKEIQRAIAITQHAVNDLSQNMATSDMENIA